jgi:hypothetical protein
MLQAVDWSDALKAGRRGSILHEFCDKQQGWTGHDNQNFLL